MDQSSNSVFKRHLSAASNSSSTSNWEPFQEERIKARAVPEETQNALANVGLRARMSEFTFQRGRTEQGGRSQARSQREDKDHTKARSDSMIWSNQIF